MEDEIEQSSISGFKRFCINLITWSTLVAVSSAFIVNFSKGQVHFGLLKVTVAAANQFRGL